MLVLATVLVLVAVACGAYLIERTDRQHGDEFAFETPAGEHTTPWHGAALNARGDTRLLQYAIVAALDSKDTRHSEAILRSALRETRGPVSVVL